jgi:hypothetical protein
MGYGDAFARDEEGNGPWVPLSDEEMNRTTDIEGRFRFGSIGDGVVANSKYGYTQYRKDRNGRVWKRWIPSSVSQPGDDMRDTYAPDKPAGYAGILDIPGAINV